MNERKDLIETIQQSVGGCTRYWAEIIVDFIINGGWRLKRWIPVSESLPEIFRDEYGELIPYLVCVNGTEYPFRAFYDGENWGDGWAKIDVIAWMPLPEPYREETR